MKLTLEEFKKDFADYIKQCELQTQKLNPPQLCYRARKIFKYDKNTTTGSFENFIDYEIWPRNDRIGFLKNIPEADKCVQYLRSIFKLRALTRSGKKLVGNELIKSNKKWDREELLQKYLQFRVYKEKNNLSVEDFIELIAADISSEFLHYEFRCLLIGCRFDQDLTTEKNQIGEFEIRELTSEEKNQMMNNLIRTVNGYEEMTISTGFMDQFIFNKWLILRGTEKYDQSSRTGLELNRRGINFNQKLQLVKELLLACRLSKQFNWGIRNTYHSTSFTAKFKNINKWNENLYGFGDFGKSYYLFDKRKASNADIKVINHTYQLLKNYRTQKVDQIDKALEHLSNAFEKNLEVYCFTELIMALESLTNDGIVITKNEQASYIEKIIDCKSRTKAKKLFNKHPCKFTNTKLVDRAIALLGKGYCRETSKFLKDCYKLRNELLHGSLQMNERSIRDSIPKLSTVVSDLLKQLLKLIVDREISLTTSDYFDELDKFIAHNTA